MPSSWAPEALKVQAVAARTYAITTSVGGGTFDLYSDTRSQMYGGVAAETPVDRRGRRRDPRAGRHLPRHPGRHLLLLELGRLHREHPERLARVPARALARRRARPLRRRRPATPTSTGATTSACGGRGCKLGRYVKGQLLGIQVTKHGASPRILLADVVGTKGRTQVTGSSCSRVRAADHARELHHDLHHPRRAPAEPREPPPRRSRAPRPAGRGTGRARAAGAGPRHRLGRRPRPARDDRARRRRRRR